MKVEVRTKIGYMIMFSCVTLIIHHTDSTVITNFLYCIFEVMYIFPSSECSIHLPFFDCSRFIHEGGFRLLRKIMKVEDLVIRFSIF